MPTPIPIETFTTKEDKVDANAAADMNAVQASIVTIETALNLLVNTNGSLLQGTSFPGSPIACQVFYRTDQEKLYVRNNANTNWLELTGTNLSNLAFQYQAAVIIDALGGEVRSTSLVSTTLGDAQYRYLRGAHSDQTTRYSLITGKYKKISGVNTVTVNAELWIAASGGDSPVLGVVIGSLSEALITGASAVNVPGTWYSNTIDVSGLTNDTIYDLTIKLGKDATGSSTYPFCGSIYMFNS